MADDLKEELRLIGCHANGDARCTCNIGQDALARIEALEAQLAAADELARAVDALHDSTGISSFSLTETLAAYRKARGGET